MKKLSTLKLLYILIINRQISESNLPLTQGVIFQETEQDKSHTVKMCGTSGISVLIWSLPLAALLRCLGNFILVLSLCDLPLTILILTRFHYVRKFCSQLIVLFPFSINEMYKLFLTGSVPTLPYLNTSTAI